MRILLVLIIGCVPLLHAKSGAAEPNRSADANVLPASGPLDDPIEPLEPRVSRSPAEQARLDAVSLFATGRMLEQNERFADALRYYQRALRLQPESLPTLRQIIPLAFNLERVHEAVRYALKAAELDPSDPMLLRQLGVHLSEEGELEDALSLYEKARELQSGKSTASLVFLTMEMGRLYQITGQHDKAADMFASVMQALDNPDDFNLDDSLRKTLLPDPAKVYSVFGDAMLKADRADEALAAYEKAQLFAPNKARHAFHLARVHFARKQYDDALQQLQITFDEHSEDADREPYELLDEILAATDKQDELTSRLEKVLAGDPRNEPLRYFLADRYRSAERWDDAEQIYGALVSETPSIEGYRGLLEIAHRRQDGPAMLKWLGATATLNGGLEGLGDVFEEFAADNDAVNYTLAAADEQSKTDAASFDYGNRLAMALLSLTTKRWNEAERYFNMALETKPDEAGKLILTWGIGLLLEEQYNESAAVFQRGIAERALPADNPAFYYYLAGSLEMADRTREALAAARKAASLGEKSARLSSRIGWVLYHAKRYDEAAESYRQLIKSFDGQYKNEEVRDVLREARLVLSNINVLQGNIPQAEEWLEQVLDEFPGDPSASNDLGYLWADQNKNLLRALEMVLTAVASEPDNTAYRDSLGWAYYRLGRYDEALVELLKATDVDDPDAVILDHLGDIYWKLNQHEKVREAWTPALEKLKQEDETDKAKAVQEKLDRADPQKKAASR